MTNRNMCPCNSGIAYSSCCKPLIAGDKIATTAETLMRSRYTAYVFKDVKGLLTSTY